MKFDYLRGNIKVKKEKLLKGIKFILFVGMLIGSYILSDRIVSYVSTLDIEMLKRILNISLVVIIVGIYFKKN